MFFRTQYVVRHFGLDGAPEKLNFERADEAQTQLALRRIQSNELVDGREPDDWIADVFTEEVVSARVEGQFTAHAPAPAKPPPAILDVARTVGLRMHCFILEFLCLVRWRAGIYGHHELVRSGSGLFWSSDRVTWAPARGRITVVTTAEVGAVDYSESLMDEVRGLLIRDEQAPVSHELLREAWNLKANSPRRALMLGVSALEVGVKAFIAKIVPQSEWMCFELPSPPVVKILTDYLPKLDVRLSIGGKVQVPDAVIAVLKKAIEKRNRVAHKGDVVEHDNSLNHILHCIQMVLYLLDYYAGQAWALSNVRDSTTLEPAYRAPQ